MEGPLYQDGPESSADAGTTARITNMDRSGNVLAQYAFPVDPLPEVPTEFATIGVTEILAVDETHFLLMERGGVEAPDSSHNTIRAYEIDITGATDIATLPALEGQDVTPVSKRLLREQATTIGVPIVDVEGMTWGPVLDNGNRSLVLVSDIKFSDTQVTQFIALEVNP